MKPELLAPCHDFATLNAAITAGANAVYFGVKNFNMRAKAGNFSLKELSKVVSECHASNVKAYLTTNTVVFDNEIPSIKKVLIAAKKACVNAVIVHDLGVLKLAHALGLSCHISTQANITNTESIKLYKKLGASRVILSRELSLKQVSEVIKKSLLPVECFIHGAMCVSISGRCFLSQTLDLKNANRGECLQPCRREWKVTSNSGELVYDGRRFLNSKDLCMIEHVPELIRIGVSSLKIEGRMRDANYVSTVVSCYREAIDNFSKEKIPAWLKRLSSVFNRGFSTGFYYGDPKESLENGNQARVNKTLIGEVINYYAKVSVALVNLIHDSLKINDLIIIEGKNTYLKQKITSLEINNHPVKDAKKNETVCIKVLGKVKVKDLVYKLTDK